jgi:hypothetical protein
MSWFAYEELIEDWCDVTELEVEKQGPALRNRLEGEAAMYKPLFSRKRLKDPDGVQYFKETLRPHFVKGRQVVFLWRFPQFFRFSRGNMDFLRWLGKLQVHKKRLYDAWMDLHGPPAIPDPAFLAWGQQQPEAQRGDPVALHLAYQHEVRRTHMQSFPLSDNFFALVVTVQADLTEVQRERLTTTLALQGHNIQT